MKFKTNLTYASDYFIDAAGTIGDLELKPEIDDLIKKSKTSLNQQPIFKEFKLDARECIKDLNSLIEFKRCFFDLIVTKDDLFLEITSKEDSSESVQYELTK